jgi:sulfate permease, SulP family
VLVAVLGLIDVAALTRLYRFDKHEFGLAAVVAAIALTLGLLPAVASGVALTLYSVLREVNRAHVAQLTVQSGIWIEGPDGTLVEAGDPLVLKTRLGVYAANLRANTDAIVELVAQCSPTPSTVVWDLSAQPTLTTTVMGGLRDAEVELAGVRVVYAALPEKLHTTARRWPWWQQVERDGRYFTTIDEAVTS